MQTITIERHASVIPVALQGQGAHTPCSGCRLKDVCLPEGLQSGTVARLDALMFARRRVKEGEVLYREGETSHFIYAVRSGTVKSTITLRDGRDQVTGFQIAGDIIGLDGLASGRHASTAHALEESHVCAIPHQHLFEVASGSADLQQVISRLLSREIVREQGLMLLLASGSAEQRVAGFLLNFARRMKDRGYSSTEFHLRMSRADLGSYLGLTLETVSRSFSALQRQRVLDVDKKHVRIVDPDALTCASEPQLH